MHGSSGTVKQETKNNTIVTEQVTVNSVSMTWKLLYVIICLSMKKGSGLVAQEQER